MKEQSAGYASFEDVVAWSKNPDDIKAIKEQPVVMDVELWQACKIYKGLKISVETIHDMRMGPL